MSHAFGKAVQHIEATIAGSAQPTTWVLHEDAVDQVSGGLGAPASGENSLLYGAALGAIVGVCLGGPPGVVAGAYVGTIAGAAVGAVDHMQ